MKNRRNILYYLLIGSILQIGCTRHQPVRNDVLNSDWKFRKAGDTVWMQATVPGCVHTDLLENKVIPDPFYQMNELEVKWVETTDWEYYTAFEVSDDLASFSNISLQFEGLDTYADVYINDSLVLRADNMFISWEIPVKNLFRKGSNEIRVYFHSAVNVGMDKLRKVPYTLMAANEIAPVTERSNVFTRKAPFHYGWDWGPRLVTCGVWKPVKIHAWNNVKIEDVYLKPINISTEIASYRAVIQLNADSEEKLNFEVWIDSIKLDLKNSRVVQPGNSLFEIDFSIENPEFWWTNGLGGQKLYTFDVLMKHGNQLIQKVSNRIGVRTIELVQEKDTIGHGFLFKLNGVPVFMKGANYIPSDIFLTRNTISNYKRVVNDALGANMNMLRFWGGAVYESEELYDLLDENGILAWNDFMFACNLQPDDSLHLDNIRKEAEYNVKRLRNHPSMALWCGNNENLSAWFIWGWKNNYSEEDAAVLWNVYQRIFYQILPNAVNKYHPEVAYWPSSPQTIDNKPADRLSGDEHDWSVWFGNVPFSAYSENVPRFVSEYGMQSYPEMKTIKAFADESNMSYRSSVMEHRQRSLMPWIAPGFNGNEMIRSYIARYYKIPEGFESFVYLSQLMQAEGVKYAIESHRKNMPHCMGSLYWQINDCWPTMSWAGVDYFGRWKALHYFVKKAFQPVYPVISREGKNINVMVISDLLEAVNITIEAKLYAFDGVVLWENNKDTLLASNASQIYMTIPENELLSAGPASSSLLQIIVRSGEKTFSENNFYFKDCKDLKLSNPLIQRVITKINENEFEIELSSQSLAKNVALSTSVTEGFFSDNFFDLIPGKSYKIKFTGAATDLDKELEIMSVNECY